LLLVTGNDAITPQIREAAAWLRAATIVGV